MNYRYLVGKSISNLQHHILSSSLMPLTRIIPLGNSYPYDLKRFYAPNNIEVIFDVGANIGQTSLFLNQYFNKSDIFAFEPIKKTYQILQSRTNKFDNIKNFNCALGSQSQTKEIYLRENSELNTLVDNKKISVVDLPELETVTITTIDQFASDKQIGKIDLLKMDVQGYELEVLYGAEHYLKNNLISFIYAETSFEKNNSECQYFENLNAFLEANNFRLSGFYEFFRWGKNKRYFGFCNALFVHRSLESLA